MDIRITEWTDSPHDEGQRIMAVIEGEVAVDVRDHGTDLYRWRAIAQGIQIHNISQKQIDQAFEQAKLGPKDADGYYTAEGSFGHGAVWWTPKTFAHAVWDIIHNQ